MLPKKSYGVSPQALSDTLQPCPQRLLLAVSCPAPRAATGRKASALPDQTRGGFSSFTEKRTAPRNSSNQPPATSPSCSTTTQPTPGKSPVNAESPRPFPASACSPIHIPGSWFHKPKPATRSDAPGRLPCWRPRKR